MVFAYNLLSAKSTALDGQVSPRLHSTECGVDIAQDEVAMIE